MWSRTRRKRWAQEDGRGADGYAKNSREAELAFCEYLAINHAQMILSSSQIVQLLVSNVNELEQNEEEDAEDGRAARNQTLEEKEKSVAATLNGYPGGPARSLTDDDGGQPPVSFRSL